MTCSRLESLARLSPCKSAPDFEKCEKSEAVKKIKGKTNPGDCSNALSRKTYIRPWREDEVEYCWLLQGDIVFCQHIVIESQMGKKYGAEAHVFSSNRISLASRTARSASVSVESVEPPHTFSHAFSTTPKRQWHVTRPLDYICVAEMKFDNMCYNVDSFYPKKRLIVR